MKDVNVHNPCPSNNASECKVSKGKVDDHGIYSEEN